MDVVMSSHDDGVSEVLENAECAPPASAALEEQEGGADNDDSSGSLAAAENGPD